MTNEFGKALDQIMEERVICRDIIKAFDKIWHRGLICKLKSIGIDLVEWCTNYLQERKPCVVIINFFSEWLLIRTGVP